MHVLRVVSWFIVAMSFHSLLAAFQ